MASTRAGASRLARDGVVAVVGMWDSVVCPPAGERIANEDTIVVVSLVVGSRTIVVRTGATFCQVSIDAGSRVSGPYSPRRIVVGVFVVLA